MPTKKNDDHGPEVIADGLRTLIVPIDTLNLDPKNVRLHDDKNRDAVRTSLLMYGQLIPIVVQKDGMIVRAGNLRLDVARELGWRRIAALVVTKGYAAEKELKKFGVMDNRSSELGEWDYRGVAELFAELRDEGDDLEGMGFLPHEIDPLMQGDWDPPAVTSLDQTDGHHPEMGEPIRFTREQREIVDQAIAKVRAEGGDDLTDGRCVELICADWMA